MTNEIANKHLETEIKALIDNMESFHEYDDDPISPDESLRLSGEISVKYEIYYDQPETLTYPTVEIDVEMVEVDEEGKTINTFEIQQDEY